MTSRASVRQGASACAGPLATTVSLGERATKTTSTHLTSDLPSGRPRLVAGDAVGRFTVLGELGVGGMGQVVSAYDPQLDRKVAIKVVYERSGAGSASAQAHARLRREARAMARLAHPNVVTVYEVGRHGASLYFAMAQITGGTLRAWLRRQRRDWREVLEVFAQAGRGLAAAHAAGLVHRDFKPDNVLVGSDGVVRVTDFGLAGTAAPEPTGAPPGQVRALATPLTCTGAIMGTPRYMAPEQRRGEPASARSDQFAFCVALYEALYGRTPHAGYAYPELARAVLARPPELPADSRVPARLARVVLRGLEQDPAARFPSMGALLCALEHDPARAGRRVIAAALGLIGLAAPIGLLLLQRDDPGRACRAGEQRLAGAWDGARRRSVAAAIGKSTRPFARGTAREVLATFDGYATEWRRMHEEACLATNVRREQSQDLLDLRMSCLDVRLGQLGAASRLLSEGAEDLVPQARRIAASPAPIADCADVRALRAPVPLPADRERLRAAQNLLAEAEVLERANRFDAERPLVERAIAEARALEYGPLEAEALVHRATLESHGGQLGAAADTLLEASLLAEGSRADTTLFAAATQLVYVLQQQKGRQAEATFWERRARSLLDRLGRPPHDVARLEQSLSSAYFASQRYPEARDASRRAIAVLEGAQHANLTTLGEAYNGLANAELFLADLPSADAHNARAHALFEQALENGHPRFATLHANRGMILEAQGRLEDAESSFRRAIAAWEESLGADHANIAYPLNNLGLLYLRGERFAEAESVLLRALAIRERRLGPAHPQVGIVESNLGLLAEQRRRWDEAARRHGRALTLWEKALPADHPHLVVGLTGRAHALLELGKPRQALALLERARAIGPPALEANRALADLYYARALWETWQDRARARNLAKAAHEALAKAAADSAGNALQQRGLADANGLLARLRFRKPE